MDNDISDIKSRLNIVDIIGEYLRVEKAGNNYRALCPFHNEKTPSFMISEERQMWHCFGCQKGGDMFSFIMEIEGLEFREALQMLAEKAGVELSKFSGKTGEKDKNDRTIEILELATRFYEVQLWKGSGKEKIVEYLRKRGFSDESIRNFRLGYAPSGWRNVLDFLLGRGYGAPEIEKTGLLVRKDNGDHYDRFRDRIIFPIADVGGRVVGYSARVAPGGDESQAKYVNTPETQAYHKSKILYGIDKAKVEIKKLDFVLLVEGNADVVASHQAGFRNTVAVSGTALTQDQINILKRYTKNIRLFFDMDQAGETATKKSVKLCFENELSVRIVAVSRGKDAADSVREDPEVFRKAVEEAVPAVEYFLRKNISSYGKDDIDGKKKAVSEMVDILASILDEVERDFWKKKIADGLDIREAVLTERLKKSILRDRRGQESSHSFVSGHEEAGRDVSRKDNLIKRLASLMLAFPEIWKFISENGSLPVSAVKDDRLRFIIQEGKNSGFDLDTLLSSGVPGEQKKDIENLFFQGKFQTGIDNGIEESRLNDPQGEALRLLQEIDVEDKKEALQKIGRDMRLAGERGDKDAEKMLREESKRVSSELSDLTRQ